MAALESRPKGLRVGPGFVQGAFYVGTGLWPLVHFRSFERVVGPKPDRFQTEATSVLFVAVGATLLAGARQPSTAVRLLALSSAATAAWVEWRYRDSLSRPLRADFVVESAFAAAAARQVLGSVRGSAGGLG